MKTASTTLAVPESERRRGTVLQFSKPFVAIALGMFLLVQISRFALVIWQHERVAAAGDVPFLFLQGVRFDAIMIAYLLLLPALYAPLLHASRWLLRPARLLLRANLTVAFMVVFFLEIATPFFLEEYDTRPNYLFVEYLRFPQEVLATVWGAYPLALLFAVVVVPAVVTVVWISLRRIDGLEGPLRLRSAVLLTFVLAAGLTFIGRSSLGHRPANLSTVAYSSDSMVNTLPVSSIYTLEWAIYEMGRHEKGEIAYGHMEYDDILEAVRSESGIDRGAFTSAAIPSLHRQVPTRQTERPLNLVIVLEESLGAEFVGSLGGLPLTPNLDRLAAQGIWFENLYATGTRSVRGIEAVVTGFLPTPSRSVVKLPRSATDFFTLAELLRRQGYDTSFFYGGGAHFDNMGRFFSANGFERLIEHRDFEDPMFDGSWGVSDQDLFRRAHAEFQDMGERPFFSLVFSTSNHSPFDFPAGEIELYEQPASTVNNAVKYADHALGEFFDLARESSYWDNTVFLVVADHNSRVYGPALVPVDRFHVPALFLGGSIAPDRIASTASQIDLLPTALSLIGVTSEHPSLGRDLTDPAQRARPGRAILQFHDTHLYLVGERAVVHRPNLAPSFFTWNGVELLPAVEDPDLARSALAHALWPQMSYRARDYRLRPLEAGENRLALVGGHQANRP